jgi:hypothetical protein
MVMLCGCWLWVESYDVALCLPTGRCGGILKTTGRWHVAASWKTALIAPRAFSILEPRYSNFLNSQLSILLILWFSFWLFVLFQLRFSFNSRFSNRFIVDSVSKASDLAKFSKDFMHPMKAGLVWYSSNSRWHGSV